MSDQQHNDEGGQQEPQEPHAGAFERTVIVQLDHLFDSNDDAAGGGVDAGAGAGGGDGDGGRPRNEDGRENPFARPLIPVQILLSSFMAALRARNGGGGGVGEEGGNAATTGIAGLAPPADFAGMGFRIDRSPLPPDHPHGQEHGDGEGVHIHTHSQANPANGNGEMGERSSLLERIEELHSRNPYGEHHQHGHLPPPFTITINFPIGLHHEKKPDPARAERILAALPKLHKGVTRRMSRVGLETTCGVCLDSLNAKAPLQKPDEEDGGGAGNANNQDTRATASGSTTQLSPEDEAKREEEIVALPCSHVFHSNCLRPWFALHTLCPMCRFDLDPESMTMSTPPPEERGRGLHDNPFVTIIERLVGGERRAEGEGVNAGGGGQATQTPQTTQTTQATQNAQNTQTNNGGRAESAASSTRGNRHHPYARSRSATEGANTRSTRSSTAASSNAPSNNPLNSIQEAQQPPSTSSRPAPAPKKFEIPKASRSLQDILVKRERENGLRCDMKDCKLGPTDESERVETADMLSIGGTEKPACSHFLHSRCYHLANGNCRYYNTTHTHQDGCVDSKCPVCKAAGKVQKSALVQ